jgi:NADPH-dependent ferric siderophore reductase
VSPGPERLPASASGNAALADRLGVQVFAFEVVDAQELTPSMRRMVLGGDGVADLEYEPGQDLMFELPAAGGATVRRRYTIRSHDRTAGVIAVDVVLHGDGPGARWAATAGPGARVEAIGPRGRITVVPDAAWHLFVGDESFLPAAFAMTEAAPVGSPALLVLEVDGAEDHQPLQAPALDRVMWVHRDGEPPESGARLVAALEALALPDGPAHAYLGGEMGVVARLRRLLADRGLTREQISPKPYWRAGVANAAHGEPERD